MAIVDGLVDAKVLFGHPKNYSNPKTRASRSGISGNSIIFDQHIVAEQIEKAKELFHAAKEKKQDIIILCEKEIYKTEVETLATAAGVHYMNHKIPAGVMTNFDTLLTSIKKLQEQRSYVTSDAFKTLTKKEQNMRKRALGKVEKSYKGVVNLRKKPGLIIIVDGQMMGKFVKEMIATHTEAIVLSSSNFNMHTDVHMVMCNVNSQRSIDYVLKSIVS